MKKVKVVLYQKPLGVMVSRPDIIELQDYKPDFLCFPEYFFVNRFLGNHKQTPHNQKRQLKLMELISKKLNTVVIGGTMPELQGNILHNTSFVFDNGNYLGFYRKINLFFAEEGIITPGDTFKIFRSRGITFGILICADVFHDESFLQMKKMGAQIVFIPTISLKREEPVEEKFKRDRDIFVRGAGLSEAVVVKVCGVKSDYKNFLQARSLIADSEDIIYRVNPDEEDSSMIIKKEIQLS
jgi:predicted amidohydrolase